MHDKNELYDYFFALRCHLEKQSRTFLTDQREVNRTKTRKNIFILLVGMQVFFCFTFLWKARKLFSLVFLCFLWFFQLAAWRHKTTKTRTVQVENNQATTNSDYDNRRNKDTGRYYMGCLLDRRHNQFHNSTRADDISLLHEAARRRTDKG